MAAWNGAHCRIQPTLTGYRVDRVPRMTGAAPAQLIRAAGWLNRDDLWHHQPAAGISRPPTSGVVLPRALNHREPPPLCPG